jgi:hypothetical protein
MAIDKVALNEVISFSENDRYLYDSLMKNYLPNLQKKVLAGKYDPEAAIKLMEYYYTVYVRPHMKDPRNYGWDSKLNVEERKAFGKYFRDILWDDYGLKELSKKPTTAAKPKAKFVTAKKK